MKENGNFSSEFLRETKIRAMSSYECKNQRMFQSVPYTDDSMLCGYAPETDSCQVRKLSKANSRLCFK